MKLVGNYCKVVCSDNSQVNCHSRLSQRLAQGLVGPWLIGPSSRVLKRRAGETQRGGWGGLSVVQGVLGSWGWHGPETGGSLEKKTMLETPASPCSPHVLLLQRRKRVFGPCRVCQRSCRPFSIPHGTAQARASVGPLAGPDMTCTIWAEEATRLAAGEAAGGFWCVGPWLHGIAGSLAREVITRYGQFI